MAYKADDYEKKMGECPRHGEQVMWLACKHVAKQVPKEIWLGPNRIAICPACSMLPVDAIEEELLIACATCIRGKIKECLDNMPPDGKLEDRVRGLEVYKEELKLSDYLSERDVV